jgi:hypothetical protein
MLFKIGLILLAGIADPRILWYRTQVNTLGVIGILASVTQYHIRLIMLPKTSLA